MRKAGGGFEFFCPCGHRVDMGAWVDMSQYPIIRLESRDGGVPRLVPRTRWLSW